LPKQLNAYLSIRSHIRRCNYLQRDCIRF
jgi:hypothetical protein